VLTEPLAGLVFRVGPEQLVLPEVLVSLDPQECLEELERLDREE